MPLLYSAKLIYNANGGSGAPSNDVIMTPTPNGFCTFTISTKKPTRTGYTFRGWATSSSASSPAYSNPATSSTSSTYSFNAGSSSSSPETTRTLYAVWTSSSLQYHAVLKYNANGGSGAPSSQSKSSSTPGASVTFTISSTVPTRTGYTFRGWATSSSASSSNVGSTYTMTTGTSSSPTNTKTIYAVWKAHTYSIKYYKNTSDCNNETNVQYTDTKTYGVPIQLRGAIFNWTGHTQTGWSVKGSSSKDYSLNATYSENHSVHLHPYWSTNTYSIKYVKGSNGTGTNVTDTKEYNIDITLRGAIFTRPGYIQTGWSKTDGGSKSYNLGAVYSSNYSITLYPYWSSGEYTVTYNANGGSGQDHVQTVSYGEQWTTYSGSGFSKPGYKLIGWSTSPDGSVVYSLDRLQSPWTKLTSITLYAVWEISSIVHVKTQNGIKTGVVYVKQNGEMKLGIVYVKGRDGNMHQNS